MKQVMVTIAGAVQEVSFRYFLFSQAELLHITGWVKNTSSGNVEALFQGDENSVGKMIRRCLNGPKSATVENVTFKEAHEPIYKCFAIK